MHMRLVAPTPHSAAVAERRTPSPASPVAPYPAEDLRERSTPGGLTPGALLEHADAEHWRVAVVGGSPAQREELHRRMVADRPGVALIGHWTPVHLDVVVDALGPALARALAEGAVSEGPIREAKWGRMALLADPWGHGVCLLQFVGRGYDELIDAAS